MENNEDNRQMTVIATAILTLPTDDEFEAEGKEGGLRDGELQMFWEGAVRSRNMILKQLESLLPKEQKDIDELVEALEIYLNAGSKESRRQASVIAKGVIQKYKR